MLRLYARIEVEFRNAHLTRMETQKLDEMGNRYAHHRR